MATVGFTKFLGASDTNGRGSADLAYSLYLGLALGVLLEVSEHTRCAEANLRMSLLQWEM